MTRFVGAGQVSWRLLEPSASECVLTHTHAVLDHLRDERGRFRRVLSRLKKSHKTRFHCTRKTRPPNPTLHEQSGWTHTSNEV